MNKFRVLYASLIFLASCTAPTPRFGSGQADAMVATPLKATVQVEIGSDQDPSFRYVLALIEGKSPKKILIFVPPVVEEIRITTAYFPGTPRESFCQNVRTSRYGGEERVFLGSMPWRGFLVKPNRGDGAGQFLTEIYAANLEIIFKCDARKPEEILVGFWYGPKERFPAAAREAGALTIAELK